MDLQLSRLQKAPYADVDRLVTFLNKTGAAAAASAVAAAPAAAVALVAVAVADAVVAAAAISCCCSCCCCCCCCCFCDSVVAAYAGGCLHACPLCVAAAAAAAAAAAEGRDKVTKALQYGCRLLAWASSSSKISEKFAAVYSKP